MINLMDINKEVYDKELLNESFIQIVGESSNKKYVYLQDKNRYLNSIFIGKNGVGKTSKVLMNLVKADIENPNCGATIVVNNEEVAFDIFALAKINKRKVHFINPYMDVPYLYNFMNLSCYDYDFIKSDVIDYKKAIKNKMIVIVNIDYLKYNLFSKKIVSMILNQLKIDMTDIQETGKTPHFLYIDDAYLYEKDITQLMGRGKEYNIGTYLFSNSIKEFENYSSDIEPYVSNIFLFYNISKYDVEHFQNIFYSYDISKFYIGSKNSFIYEAVGSSEKKNNFGYFKYIDREELDLIRKKSKSFRKKALGKIKRMHDKALKIENQKKLLNLIINTDNKDIAIDENIEKDNSDVLLNPGISFGFGVHEEVKEEIEKETEIENNEINNKKDEQVNVDNEELSKKDKDMINQLKVVDSLPKFIQRRNDIKQCREQVNYITLADINFDEE
ncbi:hypothetical protein [Clostridium perfringens]|uniref:hypothetical protein n=2 Tax=Clostridium perfringens TaxID=1502 RepID=UPI0013F146AE|nr:hypothetical protein [Clostridium perfringens]